MPDDSPPRCSFCGKAHCMVAVTDGWPQAAREAFAKAEYAWAPTCSEGQRRDMYHVGWCFDRAFYHPESKLARSSAQIQAQVSI